MRALVLVAVAILVSGCASAPQVRLGKSATSGVTPPYYKEYSADLTAQYHADREVPVTQTARVVNLSVALQSRDQGLPLPSASAAQLHVALIAPNGTTLAEAQVDPRAPQANLTARDLPAGTYLARLDGTGAADRVNGEPVGASYKLTIEILYP